MLVLKFGGTSVGSAQRMREVFAILNTSTEPQLVVLSAMAGTTNALVEINAVLREHKEDIAQTMLDGLKQHYNQVCHEIGREV
jgi:aspartate kinase